jgi:hypothetical protein
MNLKDLEGSSSVIIEILHSNFMERLRKSSKTSVKIFDVLIELRTKHLPYTSLERYQYTNQYSVSVIIIRSAYTVCSYYKL